jgi:hypothetical protein
MEDFYPRSYKIIRERFGPEFKVFLINSRGQFYKTFYGRKLRLFIITRVFVSGRPFQPSLMLGGKARVYPSEVSFRCFTL